MPSETEKAAARAEREAAWWTEWRAEDFSWDGLATLDRKGEPEKPWSGWSVTPDGLCVGSDDAPPGSRPASLQDYFRREASGQTLRDDDALLKAGLLADTPDGRFHVLHLPPRYADGSESWKAGLEAPDWAMMEAEAERLAAAGAERKFAPTDDAERDISRIDLRESADRRTQLQGTVLRAFPRPHVAAGSAPEGGPTERPPGPVLHLSAYFAAFLGDCRAGGLDFGTNANFANCGFFGRAVFFNARFLGGDANFNNAQFSGGNAVFYKTQFSGGNASFENAQFSSGQAGFENAQFSGGNANFMGAQFSGGDVNFMGAQFSGGNAWFLNAQFSGGNAIFENAQFSGGNASFTNGHFSGGDANFNRILALRALNFTRGRQAPQQAGRIAAAASEAGQAQGETLPAPDYTIQLITPDAQSAMGAFRGFDFGGARCFGPVDFSDRRFSQAPDFSGARFFDRVEFHGASLHEGVDLTGTRFKFDSDEAFKPPALAEIMEELRARAGVEALPESIRELTAKNHQKAIERFNDRTNEAARFESAYRTLKQLAAGIGARTEEQRFFALELKARQARTDSDVRVWEKRFAALYGAMSDYGQSLTRPFWWLVRLAAVMATVYITLNLTAPSPTQDLAEAEASAATMAAPRVAVRTALWLQRTRDWLDRHPASRLVPAMTGPIVYSIEITAIPLIDPNRHHPWARALSGEGVNDAPQGLHPYLFAFFRLVHRILALPLVFLFLLTLRRRFQIS